MDIKLIRKIDDLGRVVIPKDIRKALELNKHDEVEIDVVDNCIILKKVQWDNFLR